MANDVFANGREISCKAGDGKSICAFPDVCFTPPENPATPPGTPVPYPNTGLASDTTSGSKKVKISRKEVMLKNKSYFKKSVGDEAGCAAKKGVVTSVNRGKVYFNAWSMDVKMEGENVVRHLDLTTHNHASPISNTVPWLYADSLAIGAIDKCANVRKEVENNCSEEEFGKANPACSEDCCEAKKCVLSPKKTPKSQSPECCGQKTKHHIIPDHCFKQKGSGGYYKGITDMSYDKGLCICVDGKDKHDADQDGLLTHGKIHRDFDRIEGWYRDNRDERWSFSEANEVAADVCGFYTGCDKECLKQQTSAFYEKKGVGLSDRTKLRADPAGRRDPEAAELGVEYSGWRQRFDD